MYLLTICMPFFFKMFIIRLNFYFFNLMTFLLFVFLDVNTLCINGSQVFSPNLWVASSHFIVLCAGRDFSVWCNPISALLPVLLCPYTEFLTVKPLAALTSNLLYKLNQRLLSMTLCSLYTKNPVFHPITWNANYHRCEDNF